MSTRNDTSSRVLTLASRRQRDPWEVLETGAVVNTAQANRDRLAAEHTAASAATALEAPRWAHDQASHDLYAALYLQHRLPCLRLVRSYFGFDTATAEEVVDDAFTSVWVSLGDLLPSTVQGWLFQIAVNKGRDYLRRCHSRGLDEMLSLDHLRTAGGYGNDARSDPYDLVDVPAAYADTDPLAMALAAEEVAAIFDRARTPLRQRIVWLNLNGWARAEIALAEGVSERKVKYELEEWRKVERAQAPVPMAAPEVASEVA